MTASPLPIASPLFPGAWYQPGRGTEFRLWAPKPRQVELELTGSHPLRVPLQRDEFGFATAMLPAAGPGTRYRYRLTGDDGVVRSRPDPASFRQPEGVHGLSEVVDLCSFTWTDDGWSGLELDQHVFYELHVGTFTPAGTLTAAITELDRLVRLGVTAIELMPLAQFPGSRNWGYDGVFPFCVQNSYGGPEGLRELVNACHQRGLAVVLDVVYNHLGPEGNYLADFGPYFTGRYQTPWGRALNYDGADSDPVRHYFLANALFWLREFHLDGLRLDAIHGIVDTSAHPFLQELQAAVEEESSGLGRKLWLFAESDLNDVRVLRGRDQGGFGMPAQWSDDFHHALHVELTGEREGYYLDFESVGDLGTAIAEGFVYQGQYSRHRRRRHGNASGGFHPSRFVIFAQNHDQVGNRARGDRLSTLVDPESLKLAAGVVTLSPGLPLLFMGEEYGETAPFLYFTSHGDPALVEAVRRGRTQEFASFGWMGEIPDPQDEATFTRSRLQPALRRQDWHATLERLYHHLLHWRRTLPGFTGAERDTTAVAVYSDLHLLVMERVRPHESQRSLVFFHFGKCELQADLRLPAGSWTRLADSAEEQWMGPGSPLDPYLHADGKAPSAVCLAPRSFAIFTRS